MAYFGILKCSDGTEEQTKFVSRKTLEDMANNSEVVETRETEWAADENRIARPVGSHAVFRDKDTGLRIFCHDDQSVNRDGLNVIRIRQY